MNTSIKYSDSSAPTQDVHENVHSLMLDEAAHPQVSSNSLTPE
jgi:hypothetical protein